MMGMAFKQWWLQRVARWYHLRGAAHRHFGNARGDTWEYWAAVEDFTRAVTLDAAFAQAYLDRGILYWRELDHPRKAIQDLTTALTLAPQLHEARFNRGVAYQQLGEYEAALDDFRAYLAIGVHVHWRTYAERMIVELETWSVKEET